MLRETEQQIAKAAARQHGIVTAAQLQEAGLSRSAIHRRVMAGRLRPLHRCVYLSAPLLLPHSLEMAAVLASGPGALLSHFSALALWGLRERWSGPVELTAPGNRGHHPGICAHRVDRVPREDRALHEGIPVTTPARTIVDVAATLSVKELEGLVALAERRRLATRGALSVLTRDRRRHPGVRALRTVLERPGGPALTRSAAEEKFLALVREAGLAAPQCNVRLGPYEIDFVWPAAGIAVEVDGFRYHSSESSFEGDRRRDAQLLVQGITVVRYTWRQVTEQAMATAVRLGVTLARAGLPPLAMP